MVTQSRGSEVPLVLKGDLDNYPDGSLVTVTGAVGAVIYQNELNGFKVVVFEPDDDDLGPLVVVGDIPQTAEGEALQIVAEITPHAKYGRQLKLRSYQHILPKTAYEIETFLGSGLIAGIGMHLAQQIVAKFGEKTLAVLDKTPRRLLEIPGIGEKKLAGILESWARFQAERESRIYLQGLGISVNLAGKIIQAYGQEAVDLVRANPYQLAYDIARVGFQTADKIAQGLKIPPDSPDRIQAGLLYALEQAAQRGHTCLPADQLVREAAALLKVDSWLVLDQVKALVSGDDSAPAKAVQEVIQDVPYVFSRMLYACEVGAARHLARLIQEEKSRLSGTRMLLSTGLFTQELTPAQQQGVDNFLNSRVSVITGLPGTGKSFLTLALVQVLETLHVSYKLCAPTGRAAKRLKEATGREAMTIHRLIGFVPDEDERLEFDEMEDEEIEHGPAAQDGLVKADAIIVDEASMIDIVLAYRLLKAIPDGAHVLFVGDIDQLPSVGPGNFLKDLIACEQVPVVRLKEIFRQAQTSDIIVNAHRINAGEMPLDRGTEGKDFFISKVQSGEDAARVVKEVVLNRIPRRFHIQPNQIQVLSPMYKGPAGVHALNAMLQAALNPPAPGKPETQIGETIFRVGDRVMQIANNYELGVMNGEMGVLLQVHGSQSSAKLVVEVDEGWVTYEGLALEQLVLAYAISIHKAQGSQASAVCCVMLPEHRMMLARNLLYTAITRAKELCVLVSSPQAISTAVRNNAAVKRYTGLEPRLRAQISNIP